MEEPTPSNGPSKKVEEAIKKKAANKFKADSI
jgi:hypothetical protein